MTITVTISKTHITVTKFCKGKVKQIGGFLLPFSFEEFKLWFDLKNLKPHKIEFTCLYIHRKLCQISLSKFNKLDFPELETIKHLMSGEDEKIKL